MSFPSTQLYPSNELFPSTPGRVLYVEQDLSADLTQVTYSGIPTAVRATGNPTVTALTSPVSVGALGGSIKNPRS